MSDVDLLNLIFQEWSASLKSRDRSKDAVVPNFEELFDKLKSAGANFEDARAILPRAIKAHLPASAVIRANYRKLKSLVREFDKTEKEYTDDWNKSIGDSGTNAFFDIFPLPRLDGDGEPAQFGSMSAKEYKAQRRYAEQFPVLDTTELEKRMQQKEYDLDIEDMIKHLMKEKEDKNG